MKIALVQSVSSSVGGNEYVLRELLKHFAIDNQVKVYSNKLKIPMFGIYQQLVKHNIDDNTDVAFILTGAYSSVKKGMKTICYEQNLDINSTEIPDWFLEILF
jgi:hypothetical protein